MTSGSEDGRSPGRYKLPNMNTSSFKKILVSAGITGPILEAVTGAHRALFEGLNPQQKTRRLLRSLLPEPPGGWDSPAINADDGSEHVSTGGNVEGSDPSKEVVTDNGVIILPGDELQRQVPWDASKMLSGNISAFLTHFYNKESKEFEVNLGDEIMKGCLLTKDGAIIHERFKEA